MGKMDDAYGTTPEGLEGPRHLHGNNGESEDTCEACNEGFLSKEFLDSMAKATRDSHLRAWFFQALEGGDK